MSSLNNFYDKEYFDGGKGYYTYHDNGTFESMAEDIMRLFNPKSSIEIGCAKGFLVKELRRRGVKAYGIDISEYAISCAPAEVIDYLYVYDITDIADITFPKVDLIYSIDTFEHIPEEKLGAVRDFMLKFGQQYYVKVGTLKTPDWEHDKSHITMHSIEWWYKRFPEVTFEESL